LRIDVPVDLRDLVWVPAEVRWQNEGEAVALIPTRYPGAESSDDPLIKLARKTDWQDLGEDLFCGQGQRTLTTDQSDYSLLEIRKITLASAGSDSGGADPDG
jgi:type VI secretion system protein ImpE